MQQKLSDCLALSLCTDGFQLHRKNQEEHNLVNYKNYSQEMIFIQFLQACLNNRPYFLREFCCLRTGYILGRKSYSSKTRWSNYSSQVKCFEWRHIFNNMQAHNFLAFGHLALVSKLLLSRSIARIGQTIPLPLPQENSESLF